MKRTISVENVNVPNYTENRDAAKYIPVRDAILAVLPADERGLTLAELETAIRPHLPPEVFPNGDKARWWMMTVKLDLEAKGIIARIPGSKPQRVRKVTQV